MYQNKVTLIGFLGSNAEVRTNNNRSFTTLSLATKSSYKKDDKYISHTEWHRCVVFGKLSEFAKTLTKGAHIQVEGELRSREYESKKTDRKVLESAVANARQNESIDVDTLYVKTIFVDGGPMLKRIMPRAMGRANRILKRSSHITIVVDEQ